VASLLKSSQCHYWKKVSNVQAVCGRIETRIGRHDPCFEGVIDTRKVSGLIYEAAFEQRLHDWRTRLEVIG
jgi:hypothetical protein